MAAPRMETASARESRLAQERQREEASPSLIGQLRLIREEWGEGFDEDIAKPLAVILQRVRKQMEAAAAEREREIDGLQDKLDEALSEGEENAAAADQLRTLEDELQDVVRGVRDLPEVLAKIGVKA